VIEKEGLMANALAMGAIIMSGLKEGLDGVAGVTEIRGRGLMIGIELDRPCGELVARALAKGLVMNVTVEKVIRLLPPLILDASEAREIVTRLVPLVKEFLAASPAAAAA
jgi:acetylornithine/N-succinyldiaminopimelate aminotransferase